MELTAHPSFASAWRAAVDDIVRRGEVVEGVTDARSIGSNFGRAPRRTLELRPYGFRVEDPAACLTTGASRQPRMTFAMAQWLWAMRGSSDVERIAYYNERGRWFSDDRRLLNAAVGARLRKPVDQLEAVRALLSRDPTTRRAQLVLARPSDALAASRDVACFSALQAFIRGGRLEMAVTMRSQSALAVLPYDAALFMMVHLWLAAQLDLPVGPHSWLAWSMHVYEDELDAAREFLDGPPPEAVRIPAASRQPGLLETIFGVEDRLFAAVQACDVGTVEHTAASLGRGRTLEHAVAAVLTADAASRLGSEVAAQMACDLLPPSLRGLLDAGATSR